MFGLKRKNKDINKISVVASYIDGINNFDKNAPLILELDIKLNEMHISYLNRSKTIKLKIDNITEIEVVNEEELKEKNKSVLGRAAVGTLLLGPLGGIVGGISGIGKKEKKGKDKKILIITYISTIDKNEKAIALKITGMGEITYKKFVDKVKELIEINVGVIEYL